MQRLTLILALIAVGCTARATTNAKDELAGRYALKVSPTNGVSADFLVASVLELHKDGAFEQTCSGNGVDISSEGQWGINRNTVWFTELLDCAHAWPDSAGPIRAELPFSGERVPVIVVEPDSNVIYVRELEKKPE